MGEERDGGGMKGKREMEVHGWNGDRQGGGSEMENCTGDGTGKREKWKNKE